MEERKVAVGSISSSLSVFKNSKKRLLESEIKEEKEEKVLWNSVISDRGSSKMNCTVPGLPPPSSTKQYGPRK